MEGSYNSYLASVQTSLNMNLGTTSVALSNRATTTMLQTYTNPPRNATVSQENNSIKVGRRNE